MIKGKKREEIRTVPYFDHINYPTNHHFWDLSPILTVGEDPKYDNPYFDFDGFLDTLHAPFYLSLKADNSIEYFQKYFPDEDTYAFGINQYLEHAIASIDFKIPLMSEWDAINESINETLNKLCTISFNLLSVNDEYFQKFSALGIQIANKLTAFAKHCKTKLQLLDKDIYDSHYYVSMKSISWYKDPLAYFKYFFLTDGYKNVLEAYNNSEEYYYNDQKETLSAFIQKVLFRQYAYSHEKIMEVINNEKGSKAQEYINKLKLEIMTLHEIAKDHSSKSFYGTPHRPFCQLVRKLETTFPKYDWAIDLDFECIPDRLIYTKQFLERLRNAKLTRKDVGDIPLLRSTISLTYLEWFVRGIWEQVNNLEFNWTTTQVYYLLSLLELNSKGELNFGSDEVTNKFLIKGQPFKPRNYSPKRDRHIPKTIWWKSQIQNLFTQH